MAALKDIIDHLDALLNPAAFADFGPNGLQVPGPGEIGTVVTGVSAHATLLERAAAEGADLVLVHHGVSWDLASRRIDAVVKRRLQLLFDHDMALAAYHLPLDAHAEHGNNALVAAGLGCGDVRPFGAHKGTTIGVAGRLAEPLAISELAARVGALTGREPLVQGTGSDPVRTIGIVSGAGAEYLHEAIDDGLDAFLTGEPAEWAMGRATDAGVHFLAAGHYATETFGVRRLGEVLAERFGVRHVFVDVPNPV
jgi:dinuclear metal center YbgI/SA1388 family protein